MKLPLGKLITMIGSVGVLASCATGGSTTGTKFGSEAPLPETLNIDSAAYGADHFTFRKRMPARAPNDFEFYFKHCDLIGRRSPAAFYLQAEYGCTPP